MDAHANDLSFVFLNETIKSLRGNSLTALLIFLDIHAMRDKRELGEKKFIRLSE